MASKLELELDDGESRLLKLLSQAHREKETVQFVRIEYWGDESGVTLTQEQYDTVFEHVGSLPNTKEIILHYTHEAPPLPARCLQQLIYNHVDGDTTTSCIHKDDEEDLDDDATPTFISSAASEKLDYLSLHRVKVSGTLKEFEELGKALCSNRSLKRVHLSSCQSILEESTIASNNNRESATTNYITSDIQDEITENAGMNIFLQALSHLPSLQSLHLDDIQHLSQTTLTSICHSNNLQSLELWSMGTDINKYGASMALALESNQTSLRELEISSSLDEAAGNAILNMLQVNTTLDTLGLDLNYTSFGPSLAEALTRDHSVINTLHLRFIADDKLQHTQPPQDQENEEQNNDNNDNDNDATITNTGNTTTEEEVLTNAKTIIKALTRNTKLEHLHLNFYHISPETVSLAFVDSFEDLLQVNFVLAHLSLRGMHSIVNLRPDLHFSLKLNQIGRHRLLLGDKEEEEEHEDGIATAVSRKEWIETILDHKEELSVVFYLLSAKPTLCTVK